MLTSARLNLVGIVLAWVVYKWYQFFRRIGIKAEFLRKLRMIPQLTVEELKKQIKESGVGIEALVKGILDANPKEYVTSRIYPTIKLLYLSLVSKKYQYGASRRVYETPVLERVSTALTLAGAANNTIMVFDSMKSNFRAALDGCNQQIDEQSDLLSPVVRFIGHIRDSVFLRNFASYLGSSIYEQSYVLPGRQKVVFGEFTQSGNTIVVKGFKYIARSKKALVQLIESEVKKLKIIGYLSGFVLFAAIVWYFSRLTINVGAYIRKNKGDILSRLKKLIVENYACKNCGKNIRCILFRPCNHLACCKECVDKLAGICPVCRKSFQTSLEFFVC